MLKLSRRALSALGAATAIFAARHESRESELAIRDASTTGAVTVSGRVALLGGGGRDGDVASAVVYLEPLAPPRPVVAAPPTPAPASPIVAPAAPRDTVRVLWDAVRELRQTVAELREALRQLRASFLPAPEARAASPSNPPGATPSSRPADTTAAPPATVGATPVNVPTGAPAGSPGSSARRVPPAERVIPSTAIDMKQKTFIPHVRVVEAGGMVEYPNKDPFSHNVFSTTPGGAFDLGLYPRGESRGVMFRRPGVYAIYCNIHSKMSAVVVTVPAPYHARPQADGRFVIANVPPGRYRVHAWHERAPEQVTTITVAERPVTDVALTLDARTFRAAPHLNKFGQQYKATPRDAY